MSSQRNNTEVERIAIQLTRLYQGPSWLGPSLEEIVGGMDQERARHRHLAGVHTIWELVLHITAWLRISRERLAATHPRDADAAEDWPSMEGSWQEALSSLESEIKALKEAILAFPDERLQDPAPAKEEQTFYVLLHGVVQHSAYHAGQIAVLKKLG